MQLAKSLLFVGVLAALALPAVAGKLHSSIQVPADPNAPKAASHENEADEANEGKGEKRGNEDKIGEADEEINTPRLFKLAKITKEQSKAIAAKNFKGKFGKVDLENEDGDLIWSVEIGKKEMAIDAGNGKILEIE